MVAKSFQSFEQIGEIFASNGRQYVQVRNPKTGNIRTVRWYSDSEYAKLYGGTATNATPAKVISTQREALGFEKGYITIFKGNTYEHLEWFQESIARYSRWWGWYIVSTEEVPTELPEGISAVALSWDAVGLDNGTLKAETAIKQAVDALIYEPTSSEHQGKIGERLNLTLIIDRAIEKENPYGGTSTTHFMSDEAGNQYSWTTSAKSWEEGMVKTIRGTVKEHYISRNSKITALTRCQEV